MNILKSIIMIGFAACAVAACGDDDDNGGGGNGGGSLTANCKKACDTRASLACEGDDLEDCESECVQSATAYPNCKAEIEAAASCGAARPASDWECDEFDESELKEGVCETQNAAVVSCVLGG